MTVYEHLMAPGEWALQFTPGTPKSVRDAVGPWDHVVITPARFQPDRLSDAQILASALYTGVVIRPGPGWQIGGAGLGWWLGADQGYGADFLSAGVTRTNVGLSAWVTALRPPSLLAGTVTAPSSPTVHTATYKWMTRRLAVDAVCAFFGVEWRVRPGFQLDVGTASALFGAEPAAVIVPAGGSLDGLEGQIGHAADYSAYASEVVVVGSTGKVGAAGGAQTQWRDGQGRTFSLARMVDAGAVAEGAETQTAAAWQAILSAPWGQRQIAVNASRYGLTRSVTPGSSLAIWDPEQGLWDPTKPRRHEGRNIWPASVRVLGVRWPVESGMGIYVRRHTGTAAVYTDLSEWVEPETGAAQLEMGPWRPIGGRGASPRAVTSSTPTGPTAALTPAVLAGTARTVTASVVTGGAVPVVTQQAAAVAVGPSSATVRGTIDPKLFETTYVFRWRTGTGTWTNGPSGTVAASAGVVTRDQAITDLQPSTTYEWQLLAFNSVGSATVITTTFTTSAAGAAPVITDLGSSNVSSTAGIVAGDVNPNGISTTVWAEWRAQGATTWTQLNSYAPYASPGTYTWFITGLTPSTTIEWRVIAQSSAGTTTSPAQSFVTAGGMAFASVRSQLKNGGPNFYDPIPGTDAASVAAASTSGGWSSAMGTDTDAWFRLDGQVGTTGKISISADVAGAGATAITFHLLHNGNYLTASALAGPIESAFGYEVTGPGSVTLTFDIPAGTSLLNTWAFMFRDTGVGNTTVSNLRYSGAVAGGGGGGTASGGVTGIDTGTFTANQLALVQWIEGLCIDNAAAHGHGAIRIHTSPGVYISTVAYYRVQPYFALIAAINMLQSGRGGALARAERLFDWFWARRGTEGVPYDHWYDENGNPPPAPATATAPGGGITPNLNDATDSAAALAIVLLRRYLAAGGSSAFVLARRTHIETLVDTVLAMRQSDGLTIAKASYAIKYLADNSEVYAGFVAASELAATVWSSTAQQTTWAGYANDVKTAMRSSLLTVPAPAADQYKYRLAVGTDHEQARWPYLTFFPGVWGVEAGAYAEYTHNLGALEGLWDGTPYRNWDASPQDITGMGTDTLSDLTRIDDRGATVAWALQLGGHATLPTAWWTAYRASSHWGTWTYPYTCAAASWALRVARALGV